MSFIVSIHTHAGGATCPSGTMFTVLMFQSTLPRGERLDSYERANRMLTFQSTLPRGERRHFIKPSDMVLTGFNPRSRVGSDYRLTVYPHHESVSIHAPAWGATYIVGRFTVIDGMVSIHAPAWGATGSIAYPKRGRNVSIHAPAWGATG